jgi:hypothetical protein
MRRSAALDASSEPIRTPLRAPGPGLIRSAAWGIGYLRRGESAVNELFDRYGDVVTVPLPGVIRGTRRMVFFQDPRLAITVFNGPWEQLSADANLIVGDVYGSRSIGLTDGPRHLRLR